MADLWDAEYKEVDRAKTVGFIAASAIAALAVYAGLGWWSAGLWVAIGSVGMFIASRIERKYDRIRVEQSFRDDERSLGLGWDTKKEAADHFRTTPRYWRETHTVMRYFNDEGRERWGVCNKPKYWRNGEAQDKVKLMYPPTAEEEKWMEGMQGRMAREAWERGSPYAKAPRE